VPADGTRAATVEKRRLRYVAAFVGQLSDKLASVLLCGVSERKAQWQIEKLRADLRLTPLSTAVRSCAQ
jgi:hypothetical protein